MWGGAYHLPVSSTYVETKSPHRPLDGILVVDFTRVLSGPCCGRTLADLGAQVIKVEPPDGDVTRFSYPKIGGVPTYFAQQAVGKRNLSIDMSTESGRSVVAKLIETADVVLENYRPGVMQRLGLGYEVLRQLRPGIILASISGYGQTGVWAGRRAYAPVIQAEMGMLTTNASVLGETVRQDALSHADVYSGLEMAVGILSALFMRERTGLGQHVDVSMAESMLFANEHAAWHLSGVEVTDNVASMSPWEAIVTPTAAGPWVTVAGDVAATGTFGLWTALLGDVIGADARFVDVPARMTHRVEMEKVVTDWLSSWTDLDELDRVLEAAGLAMGVVRSVAEVANEPWAVERQAFVNVGKRDGSDAVFQVPRSPWRFSEAESLPGNIVAFRGEHNREICLELGMTSDEIDALELAGVLSSRIPKSL